MYKDRSDLPCHIVAVPRSGSHWIGYIVIHFTNRPYRNVSKLESLDYDIDPTLPEIKKYHFPNQCWKKTDTVILLLRDFKESTLSHVLREKKPDERALKILYEWDLFENLVQFESASEDNRLIIYYEDLMLNPREEISKIILFLLGTIDHEKLDKFMDLYEFHQLRSISWEYTDTPSPCNRNKDSSIKTPAQRNVSDPKRWQKLVSKDFFDNFIADAKQKYPDIYEKYLTRYD